jgi:hypothetical protein
MAGGGGHEESPEQHPPGAAAGEVVVSTRRPLVLFLCLGWAVMWALNGFAAETNRDRLVWWVGAAVMVVVVIVDLCRPARRMVIDDGGIGWIGRRPQQVRWDDVERVERRGVADLRLHLKSGKKIRLDLGNGKLPGQSRESIGDLIVERATSAGVELGRVVSPGDLRRMQHNVPTQREVDAPPVGHVPVANRTTESA